MRYIFPRQFSLHNVFTSKVEARESAMPFKDYTLREKDIHYRMCQDLGGKMKITCEVKKWKNRTPKRLRGATVYLVNKLRNFHSQCSYVELLRYYCPVKVHIFCTTHENIR